MMSAVGTVAYAGEDEQANADAQQIEEITDDVRADEKSDETQKTEGESEETENVDPTDTDEVLNTKKDESPEDLEENLRGTKGQECTVTFDSQGGSAVAPQTVQYGQYIEWPNEPRKSGASFLGWYTDPDGTEEYVFYEEPVIEDFTLYAVWVDALTISFVTDYGIAPEDEYVVPGSISWEPSPPSAEGHKFKGWYTNDSCEEAYLYTFGKPVTESFTLYAGWEEATTYVVTFDMNGYGEQIEPQYVPEGEYFNYEWPEEIDNHMFQGWYTDASCLDEYEYANEPVTSDITLYAKWIETRVITFVTEHGRAPVARTIAYGYETTEPQKPLAQGYAFTGWYTDETCENLYDFTTPVTEDLTLYAGWEEATTYTVTFDMNGHGRQVSPQYVPGGECAQEIGSWCDDYVFVGWYTDPSCENAYSFAEPVTEDITLYAKWIEEHRVSFVTEFGETPGSWDVGDGVCVDEPWPAPSAAGHAFTGWYTEETCENLYDFNTPVTEDLTLYAGWEAATTYVVTFDMNGHGYGEVAPQYVPEGRCAQEIEPWDEDYIFAGWYTDPSCKKAYSFEDPVTKDITLYAKWAEKHTVTFVTELGESPYDEDIRDGEFAWEPSPAPSAEGHAFTGWYTEEACENLFDFGTPITEDLTLYAGWEEAETCVVTFEMNGHGYEPVAPQYVPVGSFAQNIYPWDNTYGFAGWYTESSCENVYSFEDPVTEDITLYAKWAEVYTVTFVTEYGETPDEWYANDGDTIGEPSPAPSAEGHAFTGWYTEETCENLFDFTTPITQDLTLYAGWEDATTYVVTFDMNGHGYEQIAPQYVPEGSYAQWPQVWDEDYDFLGWYTDPSCEDEYYYSFQDPVTDDITLYAKWEDSSVVTGWQEVDGKWYYYDENGEKVVGWQEIDGDKYYFKKSTGWMLTGLQTIGSGKYFFDPDNGALQIGWQVIDGDKYYFKKSTGKMLTGMQTIGTGKYYFDPETGVMQVGWQVIDGDKYYFKKSTGKMLTGMQTIGTGQYYFDPVTGAMQVGWQQIGANKYYFKKSTGKMMKGWLNIGTSRYYLDPDTGAQQTGWQEIDGYTYYFKKSTGKMFTGKQKIGNKEYTFDDEGRLIE